MIQKKHGCGLGTEWQQNGDRKDGFGSDFTVDSMDNNNSTFQVTPHFHNIISFNPLKVPVKCPCSKSEKSEAQQFVQDHNYHCVCSS